MFLNFIRISYVCIKIYIPCIKIQSYKKKICHSFFKSLRPLSPSTKMSAEAYMYIQRALIH